jgi:putative PIG3 family NAD(P)H quinone oxidoreductase
VKSVFINEFGGPEQLELREIHEPPAPEKRQLKVRVRAAALNRADLLQRRGLYPPPAGYSPNRPGLEFAGEICESGADTSKFAIGERVFGITAGEAQSEFLNTDEDLVSRIPASLSFSEAAAVPEAYITAHDAIFTQAGLTESETLLIHAVGSGVGLAALQLGKANGAVVLGTSRTQEKLDRCREFGLDGSFVTGSGDWAAEVLERTGGRGVDVILDLVGAAVFEQNLRCLAEKGRMMLVGLTSGTAANLNLGVVLAKRLRLTGTLLRSRSLEEKADATRLFEQSVVPLLASRKVVPNVDRVFPASDVRAAHAYLESNASFGKVVLEF